MNRIKTSFLLSLPAVLMVLMGSAIGGTSGMMLAFFMAWAMNVSSCWFSGKIVLKMYGTREVSAGDAPPFHGMVARLAERAGLPSLFSIHPPMKERIARLEAMGL